MKIVLIYLFCLLNLSFYAQTRDPRSKDQANVFWNGTFPLYSLTSDTQILPNTLGEYVLWGATNENPVPTEYKISKGQVKYVYKFLDKQECVQFCNEIRKSKGLQLLDVPSVSKLNNIEDQKTLMATNILGCIEGNCADGFGKFGYSDGVYTGYFAKNKRNGLGDLKLNNGINLSGIFRNDTCCSGLSIEENTIKNTIMLINKAKNNIDYYCLELYNDKKDSRFYSFINNEFYYDWGGNKRLDSILFPKPKFNLKSYNTQEYRYDYRIINNGSQMVYCASVDGARDGMTKSWFKVIDLKTGNLLKSYGSLTSPIKASGYTRLDIVTILDDYLIFKQVNESNWTDILKYLDLNSTSFGELEKMKTIYEKYNTRDYCSIENKPDSKDLIFKDQSGNIIKQIKFSSSDDNFVDLKILKKIDQLVFVKRDISFNENNSYHYRGTYFETYNSFGKKLDSIYFNGNVGIGIHPSKNQYLISYMDKTSSIVAEYSLSNLDSLIEIVDSKNSVGYRSCRYSPTGSYVLIDKAIYFGGKLYFGIIGVPYFFNNDNSVVFDDGDYFYAFDLIQGKLKWLMNKQEAIQGKSKDVGVTYRPDIQLIQPNEGGLVVIGKKYSGEKFHMFIEFPKIEQTFDEILAATIQNENKNISNKENKENEDNQIKNKVNSSIDPNLPRTCDLKFVKPKLNISWVDNRVKCCNPNCRYRSAYIESKQNNQNEVEKLYLQDVLRAHEIETKCDNQHSASDAKALADFITNTYSDKSDWYQSTNEYIKSIISSSLSSYKGLLEQMYFETEGQKLARLKSKNRSVPIYTVLSNYCGKDCQKYCELVNIKCKKY